MPLRRVSGISLKMALLMVPPVVRLTILGLPATFPRGLGLAGVTWGQVGYRRKERNRIPCWVPDTYYHRWSRQVVVPHFYFVNGVAESQTG